MSRNRIPTSDLNPNGGAYYRRQGEPGHSASEPVCPDWMPPLGRQEWERVVEDMRERKFLSASYQPSLEVYCQSYAEWRAALVVLGREGTTVHRETAHGGYLTHHPMVKQRDDAFRRMFDTMREFGMTPASKSRISDVEPMDKPKPVQSRKEGLGVVG